MSEEEYPEEPYPVEGGDKLARAFWSNFRAVTKIDVSRMKRGEFNNTLKSLVSGRKVKGVSGKQYEYARAVARNYAFKYKGISESWKIGTFRVIREKGRFVGYKKI